MNIQIAHAVITGGGSGIGAEIASALMNQGARVTLMGRSLNKLNAVALQLNDAEKVQTIACDVTAESVVKQSFSQAVKGFGPVDILINCAGAAPSQAFHKLTAEEWNNIIAVNLTGVFHCTSEVIEAMRERKSGRIINIASTAALKGYGYVSAYCAAKHGVLGMTRALALETAQHGITVNAICPGYTDTDIIRNAVTNIAATTDRTEEQALRTFTKTNPQGRLIIPSEVASTVLWLSSENSRSITGQAISISGGEVM